MREAIIASSVLIVCVALIRKLCKGKISARLQYMLWLIVAVRLIVPGITAAFPHILPESSFSIINMADRVDVALQQLIQPAEAEDTQIVFVQGDFSFDELPFLGEPYSDGPTAVFVAGHPTWSWTWTDWMKGIWYLGMAVTGVWMLFVNIRFFHKLRHSRVKYDKYKEDCKLSVYTAKELPSPCLYGLPGRQSIYLPENVAADEEKVKHILTHEYCHYKHRDVIWSDLRCILLTVYWFHPLVWLAALLSKQDCELACDEAVIRMLGEEERISYGKTLVSLVTRKTTASDVMCAATTMTGGTENMKERLQRIVEKPRRLVIVLILCIAAVGIVAAFTFTQAKEYPEGTYLLEGESSLTVTTSCFQITFPDFFAKKAYCCGANGTDVIVYHKDSDREIGRFCMMDYEEARQLADEREVIPVGTYGSSPNLRAYISGEQETPASVSEHYYYPGEESDGSIGVPGTDSNTDDETTYLIPEESVEGTMTNQASAGVPPIPAPEETDWEIINLPFDENREYGGRVDTEQITVEPNAETNIVTENPKLLPDEEITVTYLPDEKITELYIPTDAPCYVYIPADITGAEADVQAELMEMNQDLIELADSVVILYQGRESMMRVLDILVQNRSPYIGDAVKVSKIAGALPAASGLSYRYLELETATEPYGVTLYYSLQMDNSAQISGDTQFLEAVLMFASIENLENCTIQIRDARDAGETVNDASGADSADDNYIEITYERKQMENIFGALYPHSAASESMVELYNQVLEYLQEKKD